jgi:hypothetical protein
LKFIQHEALRHLAVEQMPAELLYLVSLQLCHRASALAGPWPKSGMGTVAGRNRTPLRDGADIELPDLQEPCGRVEQLEKRKSVPARRTGRR